MATKTDDHRSPKSTAPNFRVSRRSFLRAAGIGAAGGTAAATFGSIAFDTSRAAAQGSWDDAADIVVVGSGAAGFAAAVVAAHLGNQVIMLEKGPQPGGTSIKSSGGFWVPNNALMRAEGMEDPKEDALKYMVRYSYPQYFNPDDPHLGAFPNDYDLIESYYDNGSVAFELLEEIGALTCELSTWHDYQSELPENKAPLGRTMSTKTADGSFSSGVEMIRQMMSFTDAHDVALHVEHRVERVVLNDDGAVIGVEATTADGETVAIQARKGVVFGSGCFTHDKWMVLHYQRGPMFGGCAVPTNEGDFVRIAGGLGAKMGNMTGAYHSQILLEQAVEFASVPNDVFMHYGDSSFQVNRFGHRVVNEKSNYNDRTQVHFNWDPVRAEWTNQLLFWIYDQRSADNWAGYYPFPPPGTEAPYVIQGETLEALAANIDERLATLKGHTGGVTLDASFTENLAATFERFNGFAGSGKDLDFTRGESPYDLEAPNLPPPDPNVQWPSPDQPNATMYPLSDEGPYYAFILAAGSMTTNGGPVVNAKAQVVNTYDEVIPGLYGAGSSVASPSASAYWGGGGTLGPAVVLGYLAAINADMEPIKEG